MIDLTRLSCLGDALRDALLTYKSEVALLEADRHHETARFTYDALRREAERVAAWLQGQGFAAGDRCALLMSNQSKWVIASLAVQWSGGVLVPLDYKLTADEQRRLIAHAKPRAVITEYPILRDLERTQGAAELAANVLVTEAPREEQVGRAQRWEHARGERFEYRSRTRQDVACIVYSSGTSGAAKGCMLTHDAYLEQAQVLARLFPMQPEDRYFSVLPTNHAIDFMCGTVVPFLYGAAVVHQRTLRAEFLAPTMQRYGVTHTALVPRILRTLRDRMQEQLDELPEWQRRTVDALASVNELATMRKPRHELSRTLLSPVHRKLGKLRMIIAGGAFVERELADFFYRLGIPVVIGYGLTEACTVLTVNDLSPYRADSVGKAIPGVQLELRNVGADGVGEVYARGRSLMRGYLDAPELTADTLVDGFLRTGDLGSIDASGHLRLVGRAKNMVVTEGGKNVYPEDVEAALQAIDCEELCVLASGFVWPRGPHATLGHEKLVLVLRARKGQSWPRLLELVRSANHALADYKRIAGYVPWTQEFPRTASMKIKREQLARQVSAAGAVLRGWDEAVQQEDVQ